MRSLLRVLAFGLVFALLTMHARADQKDPHLPALFDQLKAAPSNDAALAIEHQIWAIWFEAGDAEINGLLADGQTAMNNLDFKSALADYNRIVEKRPDFAEGWNRRATLYYVIGEYQKSLDDIARTLALEPRHFGALSGLGLVNLKLDRESDAAKAYERFLAIDPQNESAQKTLDMLNTVLKRKSI